MRYDRNNLRGAGSLARSASRAEINEGLRTFMLNVYNLMALGLGVTGFVAYFVAQSPVLMQAIFGTPLAYIVMFAPLGFALALSFGINRMQASTAGFLFYVYAGVMGLSLASIFVVYTGQSIARAFFATAATFGAMSLYGYTTKRDLSGIGSFLFMGLIGVLIASLVNLFLGSSALQFAISMIGVMVFVGLTAYDTQMLKQMYYEADSVEIAKKKAIFGALTLYLDFINMFLLILRFFDRR